MAWDEWEQLKSQAAERQSTQMQLNGLPEEDRRLLGDGSRNGDLTVNQKDLAAVGDSAFKLYTNVMHAVAQPDGGADLVTEGIGDSLGNMASAYMPEISRVLAGRGAESILLTDSADPTGLDKTDTTRFLYEVSTDPNGRAGIILGQTVYASSALEAHIANPSLFDGSQAEAIRTISESAGVIQGIVGHANADEGIKQEIASENEQNDALKTKGDTMKAVIGAGIGAGVAALLPGAANAVAGAAASGYFGGIAGLAVDRLMEGQQAEGDTDRALYRTGRELNDYQESVLAQTQQAAVDAIEKYGAEMPTESTRPDSRRGE
ncbi:hypothetical protein [Streptomyces peucetius]